MRDASSTFLNIALAMSPSNTARLIYEGFTHCIVERVYLPDQDEPFHYLLTLCNDEDDPGQALVVTKYQDLLTTLDIAMKKWGEDNKEDKGIHLCPYWAAIGAHA